MRTTTICSRPVPTEIELALNTAMNSDGSTSETLTYQNYNGQTNGSFSAVSETGTGSNLAGAYQSLLSTLQANGELNACSSSQPTVQHTAAMSK
jgi:hypothetical protein